MSRRTPAHRAQKPRFSLLSLGLSALVLTTAIVFSISASGGTYAYLSASQPVVLFNGSTTATITAGTATLTVNSDTIGFANLYPGDSRSATITVGNTGVTALALSIAPITGPSTENGLTAAVAPGTCPGTSAGVPSGPLGVTLAPGASAPVCLAVGMSTTAPSAAQSLGTTVTVALTGTQP